MYKFAWVAHSLTTYVLCSVSVNTCTCVVNGAFEWFIHLASDLLACKSTLNLYFTFLSSSFHNLCVVSAWFSKLFLSVWIDCLMQLDTTQGCLAKKLNGSTFASTQCPPARCCIVNHTCKRIFPVNYFVTCTLYSTVYLAIVTTKDRYRYKIVG